MFYESWPNWLQAVGFVLLFAWILLSCGVSWATLFNADFGGRVHTDREMFWSDFQPSDILFALLIAPVVTIGIALWDFGVYPLLRCVFTPGQVWEEYRVVRDRRRLKREAAASRGGSESERKQKEREAEELIGRLENNLLDLARLLKIYDDPELPQADSHRSQIREEIRQTEQVLSRLRNARELLAKPVEYRSTPELGYVYETYDSAQQRADNLANEIREVIRLEQEALAELKQG